MIREGQSDGAGRVGQEGEIQPAEKIRRQRH